MTPAEVTELMRLKGWSRTKLAAELAMSEAGIHKWFRDEFVPGGPVSILLRIWLNEARRQNGRPRKQEPVTA